MASITIPQLNGVMPIIAEGCVPGIMLLELNNNKVSQQDRPKYQENVRKIFSKVKECGFNAFICEDSIETAQFILDATSTPISQDSEDCFLPNFLRHQGSLLNPYLSVQAVKEFGLSPRTLGWNLIDEPSYFEWGDAIYGLTQDTSSVMQSKWNCLSTAYMITRELAPEKITYWTLSVPEIQGDQRPVIGNCKDYQSFLDELQRLYKPMVWVYDVYPVIKKHSGDKEVFVIRHSHFYYALRMFSDQSLKTNTPFWAYGMIHGHNIYQKGDKEWETSFPIPTLGQLRFELFSALACGAQGLVFYKFGSSLKLNSQRNIDNPKDEDTYLAGGLFTTQTACMFPNNDPLLEPDFCDSLISVLKKCIKEIKQYNSIFFGAKIACSFNAEGNYVPGSSEIYQIGSNYKVGETDRYSFPSGTGIAGLLEITPQENHPDPNSSGVLFSKLKNGSRQYLVLVSHDPLHTQILYLKFHFMIEEVSFTTSQLKLITPAVLVPGYPASPSVVKKILPGTSGASLVNGYYRLEEGGFLIFEII